MTRRMTGRRTKPATSYRTNPAFFLRVNHASLLISSGFPYIDMIPDGDSFTMTNVGTVRAHSSLGGSGCSEGFQSGGTSCILNAIYNAVGIRIGTLPATPAKVKKAIEEKAAGTYEPQKAFDFGYVFYEELDRMIKNPPQAYSSNTINNGH